MKHRTAKVIYWSLTIVFSLFMVFSALSELAQNENAKKGLTDLGYPIYLNYILGIAKFLGVFALLQTGWRTIKEWAYAGFTIDIVGAGASIVLNGGGTTALIVAPFLLIMFSSYYLWKKYQL